MNQAIQLKITEAQLLYWLKHPIERMLENYSRLWAEERMSGHPFRSTIDVDRHAESLVRYLRRCGYEICWHESWEPVAEAFKGSEYFRWIIPHTFNQYLNDPLYSPEEKKRLREAWATEQPTVATFSREIAEKHFPYPYGKMILDNLDELDQKTFQDA